MVLFGVVPLVVLVCVVVGGVIGAYLAGVSQGLGGAFGYPGESTVVLAGLGAIAFGYIAWLAYDPVHLWPGLVIIATLYLLSRAAGAWRTRRRRR